LRHVVTDNFEDPVGIFAGELFAITRTVSGSTIEVAGNGDGGHRDDRSFRKLQLEIVVLRFTLGQALPPAVVVDDHIDVVRIFEGRRGAVESSVIEIPFR